MAYSDNDLKVLTGFKIDETALQQGVKEAIGNVEKISEVRIPITINGKEGVQVLRQYMDELNNTISTSQNFMKGANSQFMASNEKITSFAEATNKAKSGLDALNNKIKSIDASFDAQTKSGEMVINNLKEYTKAMTAGNKTEKQFSYQGQVLTETTQEYYDSVNKATRYIKTFTDAQGNSVSVLDKTAKKVTTLGVGFSDMIGTMMKVAQFQVITKVLNSFTMALTSSVDIIKDFDDALTEFKKVSELSGEALNDYTEKLGELGSEVARTRSEMISSATEFRKSGFSDEDSAQLAKISEMYRNTADDAITSSESAGFIVSQMKAYNNETEEFAQHTIDAVNNVSDNLAVSSTDISNGLSKTASAMSALGNSFEESMAMVAGATEVLHGQATKVARG